MEEQHQSDAKQVLDMHNACRSSAVEIAALRGEIGKMNALNETLDCEISSLRVKAAEREVEFRSLRETLDTAHHASDMMSKDFDQGKVDLEKAERAKEVAEKELSVCKKHWEAAEEELRDVHADISRCRDELMHALPALAVAENTNIEQKRQIEKLDAELLQIRSQLAACQKELVVASNSLHDAQLTISTMNTANNDINGKLLAAHEQISAVKTENKILTDTVKTKNEELKATEELHEMQRSDMFEFSVLEEDLKSSLEKCKNSESKYEEQSEKMMELQSRILLLESELSQSKYNLQIVQETADRKFQDMESSTQKTLNDMTEKLADYEFNYKIRVQLEASSSTLESNLINIQAKLNDTVTENKTLKDEIVSSQHSNDELSKEIARVWDELNTSEQSRLAADDNLLAAHQKISDLQAELRDAQKASATHYQSASESIGLIDQAAILEEKLRGCTIEKMRLEDEASGSRRMLHGQ